MTIRYGSTAYDPATFPIPQLDPVNAQGHPRMLESWRNLPIGAAPGDQLVFGQIPSSARIMRGSTLYFGALTTVTSFDLGLYVENGPMTIGAGAAACLISALDVHLAGKSTCDAILPAQGGKYAWELAGLASDPGSFLLVVGVIHAAGGTATAAADFDLHLSYRTL